MPGKYLSAGTATFTLAAKTITGATMSTVFASTDVGKPITFRIGTTIYDSWIASVESGTDITLEDNGALPSGNGTVVDIIVFGASVAHVYQDYLTELGYKIRDDANKLSATERGAVIAEAVIVYSKDLPMKVKKVVTSTGAASYVLSTILGTLWKHNFTQIFSIESPAGEDPAEFLDDITDYEIYDDGTAQDGSNLTLRFLNGSEPASGDTFIVQISLPYELPSSGSYNFPDTVENFANITTLAAAYACRRLAAAYVQSKDSSITADTVGYRDKSDKYLSMAKAFMNQYRLNVFGTTDESSVDAAFEDVELDVKSSRGGRFLFHDRKFSGL